MWYQMLILEHKNKWTQYQTNTDTSNCIDAFLFMVIIDPVTEKGHSDLL